MSVTESTHTSKDLAKEILDAFQLLAQMAPELAYTTYNSLAPIVSEAEYERIEIIQKPCEDSPEDFDLAVSFRGELYEPDDLVAVDTAERWTYASSVNPDESVVTFNYDSGGEFGGFLYLVNNIPVRLPEGWKELS